MAIRNNFSGKSNQSTYPKSGGFAYPALTPLPSLVFPLPVVPYVSLPTGRYCGKKNLCISVSSVKSAFYLFKSMIFS